MLDAENKEEDLKKSEHEAEADAQAEAKVEETETTEESGDETQPSNDEVSETEELEKELDEAETEEEQERIAFMLKNKFKAKANEATKSAEELRRELEAERQETALLKAALKGEKAVKSITMPDAFDYDTDEEHQAAMQEFFRASNEDAARKIIADERQQEAARKAQEARNAQHAEIEDRHIARAAKFIQNSEVSEEDYLNTQAKVKEVFGEGLLAEIMDFDNSEAIVYDLGKSPSKMQEFVDLFNQPNGAAKAFRNFTRYADKVGKVTKQSSRSSVEPDEKAQRLASGGTDYQARIDLMREKGAAMSKVLELKREAKAAGVDVF